MEQNEQQQEFDAKYITATEVMQRLNISRTALLYARRSNKLPQPIVVNDGRVFIWERQVIQSYLDSWKMILDARRGV